MVSKRFSGFILLYILILFGCDNSQNEVMYYSPYNNGKATETKQSIIFQLNGTLFEFKDEKMTPLCNLDLCEHNITDYSCQALVDIDSYIGYYKNELFIAYYEGYDLIIKRKSLYSKENSVVKKIRGASYEQGGVLFKEGYCYYTSCTPGGLNFSAKAQLKRCSIIDDDDPEILWEEEFDGKVFSIANIQTYGDKIVMFVNVSDTSNSSFYCYIYDMVKKKIQKSDPYSTQTAYADGNIVSINENGYIVIYNIERDDVSCEFNPKEFFSLSSLACDSEYIYISHSKNNYSNKDSTDYNYIDVYNYGGKYVNRIFAETNAPKNEVMATYMCSNRKYIFIGESIGSNGSILYMIKKSEVFDDEIRIYHLFEG